MRRKTAPLYSIDGSTLVTDMEDILNLWQEHFSELLNRESRVELETIDNVLQTLVRTELDDQPLLEDVQKAIRWRTTKPTQPITTTIREHLTRNTVFFYYLLVKCRKTVGNKGVTSTLLLSIRPKLLIQ